MLAETIDAGLLRRAAERKNDERILVQIRGKDCVALEVHYHKVCDCNYTKYVPRETKDQSESKRSVSLYEKSCKWGKNPQGKSIFVICASAVGVWLMCPCVFVTKTMAVLIFQSAKLANFGGNFFPIVHLFRLGSSVF